MNLVVDRGNSAAKVGIFDHQNLMEKHTFSKQDALKDFLQHTTAENIIVSSVKTDVDELLSWTKQASKKFVLHHTLPLPITNLYSTPATLGVDRLAGVCGAKQIFPSQACLVIDAGTCITYDFIDKDGNYQGGSISPGLTMRFQAVHTFTAKLPLVSPNKNAPLIGNSTESSIQSGVVNGMLAEIEGIIGQYTKKFGGVKVILCGGDAVFFENQVKASIFASPELVLIGLNSILNYNVYR
jgi:type III pantothenate kinase